jgi:hypothetical protein
MGIGYRSQLDGQQRLTSLTTVVNGDPITVSRRASRVLRLEPVRRAARVV